MSRAMSWAGTARVHLVTNDGVEDWPEASKDAVARTLVERIASAYPEPQVRQVGSAGIRISRQRKFSPSNRCSLAVGSSPIPTAKLIASSAAKLPTVPLSAPRTPSSAQLSQSLSQGVADKAPIAWLASEQCHLTLELHRRRRQKRNTMCDAGVAYCKAGREIVAAVDDEIMFGEQARRIVDADPLLIGRASTKRLRR